MDISTSTWMFRGQFVARLSKNYYIFNIDRNEKKISSTFGKQYPALTIVVMGKMFKDSTKVLLCYLESEKINVLKR